MSHGETGVFLDALPSAAASAFSSVFNAGLDGNAWRAIDLFEGDKLNQRSFKALVKRAARYNTSQKKDT